MSSLSYVISYIINEPLLAASWIAGFLGLDLVIFVLIRLVFSLSSSPSEVQYSQLQTEDGLFRQSQSSPVPSSPESPRFQIYTNHVDHSSEALLAEVDQYLEINAPTINLISADAPSDALLRTTAEQYNSVDQLGAPSTSIFNSQAPLPSPLEGTALLVKHAEAAHQSPEERTSQLLASEPRKESQLLDYVLEKADDFGNDTLDADNTIIDYGSSAEDEDNQEHTIEVSSSPELEASPRRSPVPSNSIFTSKVAQAEGEESSDDPNQQPLQNQDWMNASLQGDGTAANNAQEMPTVSKPASAADQHFPDILASPGSTSPCVPTSSPAVQLAEVNPFDVLPVEPISVDVPAPKVIHAPLEQISLDKQCSTPATSSIDLMPISMPIPDQDWSKDTRTNDESEDKEGGDKDAVHVQTEQIDEELPEPPSHEEEPAISSDEEELEGDKTQDSFFPPPSIPPSPTKQVAVPFPSTSSNSITRQALQAHEAFQRLQPGRSQLFRSMSLNEFNPKERPRTFSSISFISGTSGGSSNSMFSNTLKVTSGSGNARGGLKRNMSSSRGSVGLSLGLQRDSVVGFERSDIGRMEDFEEDEGEKEDNDVD